MNSQIRKANTHDAEPIAAIVRELGWFAHVNAQSPQETVEMVTRHLELCLADDSHSIYVAEVDGVVRGYAAVHWCPYLMMAGPEGYVSELFVAAAARGQGIGARLLNTVEEEARARGCSRLGLLNLRNRESYQRNFYKNHGWVERDQVANFIFKLLP